MGQQSHVNASSDNRLSQTCLMGTKNVFLTCPGPCVMPMDAYHVHVIYTEHGGKVVVERNVKQCILFC